MSMDNQRKHDLLMEMRPDGAQHDSAKCMYCTVKASEEGTVAEDQKIFTQEQHEQLLASAVEKASVEARATADAEVLSLNEQLEAATKAKDDAERALADLEAKIAERDEADRLAALIGERVDAVKAVADFSDEQIEKRKESWSKMDEDAFAVYLEDLQAVAEISAKAHEEGEGEGTPKTKFDGTRTTAGKDEEEDVLRGFFSTDLTFAAQS